MAWLPDEQSGVLPARSKVVIWDIENWQGGTKFDAMRMVREFWSTVAILGLKQTDQVIVGMSHFTRDHYSFALPLHLVGCVVRSGKDGADLALINQVNLEHMSKYWQMLVVISADHAFTAMADRARRLGMLTWIVTTDRAPASSKTLAAFDGRTRVKLKAVHRPRPASRRSAAPIPKPGPRWTAAPGGPSVRPVPGLGSPPAIAA
ncbi:MAG: hypothetical protein LBJ62_04560 [Bifidobacteriaceae bacterium]|nr:hypothetical protein [Bifidobacteriaceae bacterium]